MPSGGCFLAEETYEVSLCDTWGDGWNGAQLSIGSQTYYGPYGYMDGNECLSSLFTLSGDGGCNVDAADNFSVDADWDNGSCLYPAPAPSGLVVSGEDSPDDYPGEIGFRMSWDAVPYAERYVLAWWDESEAPETGDPCDYYYGGGGGTISCYGECWPTSWLSSGTCSYDFNCLELDWDGEDCCISNDIMQSDDDTALCYETPALTCAADETLVEMNAGYCCSNEHSFQILDNADDSVVASGSGDAYEGCHILPASWRVELHDSYGDGWDGATLTIGDTTYGSTFSYYDGNFECTNSDGTDCAPAGPQPGESCMYSCFDWSSYSYYDCASEVNCFGNCSDPYYLGWIGDWSCDSMWDCAEYDYDNWTCGPMASGDDMPILKIEQIEEKMSQLEFRSNEWYKLNNLLPSLENPSIHGEQYDEKRSNDEISVGYDIITDYQIKVASGNNPNSNEYRAALGFNVWKETSTPGAWALLGFTTDGTTYQVTTDPVGCYAVSAYDTDPVFESGLSVPACLAAPDCPIEGDVTQDGTVNVSDIVYLVNAILGSGLDAGCADMNGDGAVNVSDVVALVNVILSGRISSTNDASETILFVSENSLKLESNGFVQGVQLTLSHDSGFEIELSDAYVSEYKTVDNQTTLILVTDGSHSINDIATFDGDMVVESIHVVNQSGDVSVEETVELVSFDVKVTGPNPFNPSTQLNIVVPEAGFVSVNVYNILGQKVATLVDRYMEASNAGHMVNFNASHLASGVYLVRAITADNVATQKLMLLK